MEIEKIKEGANLLNELNELENSLDNLNIFKGMLNDKSITITFYPDFVTLPVSISRSVLEYTITQLDNKVEQIKLEIENL